MKAVEDVVAAVIDYGTFIEIAAKLGETMARVYYHSPYETEYQDVRNCIKGVGLENVERLDEILDPAILHTIDLFVFPDIGWGGLQRHLRDLGKSVWGHIGATDLELYRDHFLDVLEQVGLPTIHSERIVGLSRLVDYLKEHDHQWVKINRFRGNMETWEHKTYAQSLRTLDSLAVTFGAYKEYVIFEVQEHIESEREIGYDGWCIDGQFPPLSFQGYEKKNELYLGSLLSDAELPDEIRQVNEAMAPVLASYGYRNWWATEIRVSDDIPYFIDPTPRMPGQTGEHQLETCANFADVIWQGANGNLIEPVFMWQFAAEATLHYKQDTKDEAIRDEWKRLEIDSEVERWVKLYHYCKVDGAFHVTAGNSDEVGIVMGVGDSIEECVDHLKANLDLLKDVPVHAELSGFADLLESIKEAEKAGQSFGGKVPKPEAILKKIA